MQYIISFLEGIITFISPCLLPMLPIYISYFAGGGQQEESKQTTIMNAVGFVAGFTLVFVMLGAFAGSVGHLLKQYTTMVNIITGFIVVMFGLNFLGILNIGILNVVKHHNINVNSLGVRSAFVFGIVFSIGWTPCVGAFLGSALMLAAKQGSIMQGVAMLLCYCLGLGIPFVASAMLIKQLQNAFSWIKAHYRLINAISGGLLIIVGMMMMTGLMGYFLSLLTF